MMFETAKFLGLPCILSDWDVCLDLLSLVLCTLRIEFRDSPTCICHVLAASGSWQVLWFNQAVPVIWHFLTLEYIKWLKSDAGCLVGNTQNIIQKLWM